MLVSISISPLDMLITRCVIMALDSQSNKMTIRNVLSESALARFTLYFVLKCSLPLLILYEEFLRHSEETIRKLKVKN